jgi:hypothetical protein
MILATSAREAALLILYVSYPDRVHIDTLADQVSRHGYKKTNSKQGVSRIKTFVDDSNGSLKLRIPGLLEAEKLIDNAEKKLWLPSVEGWMGSKKRALFAEYPLWFRSGFCVRTRAPS